MRVDETDLLLFRHVAEAGSITHGAVRANLALTAASARIRQMEARLGVVLLDRKRHGVTLSAAGRVLLAHARQLLAQADRLRDDMAIFDGGHAGHVRLFANTNSFATYLPSALASFLLKNPKIDIRTAERPSEAILPLVADGTADIGIVAAESDLAGLAGQLVATDRYVVIAPRGHALASQKRIEFAGLLAFDIVAGPSHRLFEAKAARLGSQLRARVLMRDDGQVCDLVAAGIGIGIVPLSVARRFRSEAGLKRIDLLDPWARRHIHAFVRNEAELPQPARLLYRHLVETAGPEARR